MEGHLPGTLVEDPKGIDRTVEVVVVRDGDVAVPL